MKPPPLVALSLALSVAATVAKEDSILIAPTEALPPGEEMAKFALPEGFSISLFAAEPTINKPMNLAFDGRGRLWVTTTAEYPYAAPGDREGRDRIVVLEDTTGDGRADKTTTFADGLNIPTGILPDPDGRGCIAWSIPNIWRFEDTDGDGVADSRTKLYGPLGFERDTHGMSSSYRRGADGWIYTTHGFSNNSVFRGADGSEVSVNSGNTVRLRRDGSRVEQVTHGQVNPFGLFFDRHGYLYSADCHSRPLYNLIAGGYYPSFGKPDDGLGFAPPMIEHTHGSTGIAGVVVLDDARWPAAYRDHVLIGNPVTGTINHDSLVWTGASPEAVEQPEFLTCDDGWFRPVDLQLGPDGSLYVADFYNCIIGHYEVPLDNPRRDRTHGRIWRIAPAELAANRPPDLTGRDLAGLIAALSDQNITVRNLATDLIEDREGQDAVGALRAVANPPLARAAALHLLDRLGQLGIENDLLPALASPDALVRTHALRIVGEQKEWSAPLREATVTALTDPDPHVRRAAAGALAARPSSAAIDALVAAGEATGPADDHTHYTIRTALRNNFQQAPGAIDGLPQNALLASVMPAVRSAEAARYLVATLADPAAPDEARFLKHIAAHLPADERVGTVREIIGGRAAGDPARFAALLKMANDGAPGAFRDLAAESARTNLTSGHTGPALDLAAHFRLAEIRPELIGFATAADQPLPGRLDAVRVLATLPGDPFPPAIADLVRTAASDVQRQIATALASSEDGSSKLIGLVGSGTLPPAVLQDPTILQKLDEPARARAEELTANLVPRSEALAARIRALTDSHPSAAATASEALGHEVFTANCAVCHRLEAAGATAGVLGPALDGVGARGAARLLEDILDPNRQVDPAFQMETLTLRDGSVHAGLVRAEDAATNTLLLASPAGGDPAPIPLDEIVSREKTTLSLMPPGMADLLSDEQIHALVAYLAKAR